MSIAVRSHPKNLTAEQYEEVVQREETTGQFPPDGREFHVCFGVERIGSGGHRRRPKRRRESRMLSPATAIPRPHGLSSATRAPKKRHGRNRYDEHASGRVPEFAG